MCVHVCWCDCEGLIRPEEISLLSHTASPVFLLVLFGLQRSLFPPHSAVMTRCGFEASHSGSIYKIASCSGTDSLSASSGGTDFTHTHTHGNTKTRTVRHRRIHSTIHQRTAVGSGKALTSSEQRCCGDGDSGSGVLPAVDSWQQQPRWKSQPLCWTHTSHIETFPNVTTAQVTAQFSLWQAAEDSESLFGVKLVCLSEA